MGGDGEEAPCRHGLAAVPGPARGPARQRGACPGRGCPGGAAWGVGVWGRAELGDCVPGAGGRLWGPAGLGGTAV